MPLSRCQVRSLSTSIKYFQLDKTRPSHGFAGRLTGATEKSTYRVCVAAKETTASQRLSRSSARSWGNCHGPSTKRTFECSWVVLVHRCDANGRRALWRPLGCLPRSWVQTGRVAGWLDNVVGLGGSPMHRLGTSDPRRVCFGSVQRIR